MFQINLTWNGGFVQLENCFQKYQMNIYHNLSITRQAGKEIMRLGCW